MDNTYTIIPDFLLDYDLSLAETVALAVIYGFCQDGGSDFHGSYSYLARKCKVTRSWVVKIINSLVEKGLISKEVKEVGDVKSCSFRVTFGGGVENTPGVVYKIHQGGVENTPGGGVESTPNNIYIENIDDNIKKEIYKEKFNFLSALIFIGVSKETAQEWLQVRKTKRLTNTKIAFERIRDEILKTGRSAEDCIRLSVENSWGGFKAGWMPPEREEIWHGDMDDYVKKLKEDGTLK